MKRMKTYRDFVIRYWIVLLGILTVVVMAVFYVVYGG